MGTYSEETHCFFPNRFSEGEQSGNTTDSVLSDILGFKSKNGKIKNFDLKAMFY